ncbi:baseplate J/gp47 family protein [Novispirillum itersonii]|uniref:Baseplate protein J-like domain-containing protein n=1 Tax=Novispirillum itersonii TaxID=189 RepID=A0A7X0DNS0_NOVIT|nr:hypothetical protein [Novispirillum itersonii]MBB6212280.1 hypothetical protein [Novispirillum itersonii]
MSLPPGLLVLNGADNQMDRRMAALSDAYVAPDERTFDQLLAFAVEYARLIVFYDLEDRPDGDWSLFFAADPTFALASIAQMDLQGAERHFDTLLAEARAAHLQDRRLDCLWQLARAILDLATLVERWLSWPVAGPQSPVGQLLHDRLMALVRRELAEALRQLASLIRGEDWGGRSGLDLSAFGPHWGLGPHHGHHDCRGERGFGALLETLAAIFTQFIQGLAELRQFAAQHLLPSLTSADHAPQAALYIAFARLFSQPQAALDTFSSRLTRFYYGDVLRETVRAEEPDRLFLTFTPSVPPVDTVVSVPAGTQFPAGTDQAGQAIAYQSLSSLGVTAAAVAEVWMVRRVTAPLFESATSPPQVSPTLVPSQVLTTTVALPTKPAPVSWATFGEAACGTAGIETTAAATLGFALSSPVLLLSGGQRSLLLVLSFSNASLLRVLPLVQQLAGQTGVPAGQILCQVLGGGLSLFLSAAGGWLAVDDVTVALGQGRGRDMDFTMSIALPDTAAAVLPVGTPLPKGATPPGGEPPGPAAPDTGAPVLTGYVTQDRIAVGSIGTEVEVFPYAILGGLDLTGVSLQVSVAGLAPTALSNANGTVSASKPFSPFGAPAALGSSLVISQPELFAKQLDSLSLNTVWYTLPQTDQGFKTYYQDYILGPDGTPVPDLFDNQTFLADISVDQPGYWTLADPLGSPSGLSHYLFRTGADPAIPDPDAPLTAQSVFSDLAPVPTDPPAYYQPTDSALRLTLSAPSYAFGDQLYARNVMAAVTADLPDPVRAEAVCRARCAPVRNCLGDGTQVVAAAADALDGGAHGVSSSDMVEASLITAVKGLAGLARGAFSTVVDKVARSGGGDADAMRADLAAIPDHQEEDGLLSRLVSLLRRDPSAGMAEVIGQLQGWSKAHCAGLSGEAGTLAQAGDTLLDTATALIAVQSAASAASGASGRVVAMIGLATAKATLTQAADACMATCLSEQLSPKPAVRYPNQPWQPMMASLTIDYQAASSLPVQTVMDGQTQFFYLTPFGGTAPVVWPEEGVVPLLPPLAGDATLLLGLSGISGAQPLSLLFQMASSPADWTDQPPPLRWTRLDGQSWLPLPPVSDGTNGLQNSGILAFDLPASGTAAVTQLPADSVWLAATTHQAPEQFPRTAAVIPNALEAQWIGPGGADSLGVTPVPEGTIKAAASPLAGIGTVTQPLDSFGGRPRLVGEDLYPWLGERLRHKNRAVQAWDYARLVLAEFPFVWQCQALAAFSASGGGQAGAVLVVVVPGPATPDVADPTVPVANALQLAEIGTYLQGLASPFVALQVANPTYVRICVTADVLFDNGGTPQRLEQDLIGWLSPWYYDVARAALGGRYVTEDAIAAFIRSRPYVAAILEIAFGYDPDPASLSWCYLTSAPHHDITAVDDDGGAA